jgi:single-strand DNA-binding protein
MNLNKVMLIGRVTAQPELRTTPGGQSVSTFGLATNRTWNDKAGQKQDATEFHNIVVWGRQAEVANKFMTKGMLLFVEGRLQTRGWQDKNGASHKTTEIICENFQFGPKPGMGGQGGSSGGFGGGMGGGGIASGGGGMSSSGAMGDLIMDMGSQEPKGSAGSNGGLQEIPLEELPTIDLEDDIKPEDIPF